MNIKSTIISILAMIISYCADGQIIKVGDNFFDGECLYTCREIRNNKIVYFIGEDYNGDQRELTLKYKSRNEYELQPSYQAEDAPFNVTFGCQVNYICNDEICFLEVLNKKNNVEWVLMLTHNKIDYCLSLYPSICCERVFPVSSYLLNRSYLSRFPKPLLRIMRNTIYALHGYQFEKKEMQELFSSMNRCRAKNKNAKKKLNIIEKTNLRLIMAEEAMPDELRKNQNINLSDCQIEYFMIDRN